MKTPILFLFFLLSYVEQISAQRNHQVYLEMFGSSLGTSINYDVRFTNRENGFGLRIGISRKVFPFHLNYVIGAKSSKLECGLGTSIYFSSRSKYDFIPSGTLMYRYNPNKIPISLRIGIAPNFVPFSDRLPTWLLWIIPGISLGYRF